MHIAKGSSDGVALGGDWVEGIENLYVAGRKQVMRKPVVQPSRSSQHSTQQHEQAPLTSKISSGLE